MKSDVRGMQAAFKELRENMKSPVKAELLGGISIETNKAVKGALSTTHNHAVAESIAELARLLQLGPLEVITTLSYITGSFVAAASMRMPDGSAETLRKFSEQITAFSTEMHSKIAATNEELHTMQRERENGG